jgi:hypothetical protein
LEITERVDRVEDAVLDLATVLTEGAIPKPSFLTVTEVEAASERLAQFVRTVAYERGGD